MSAETFDWGLKEAVEIVEFLTKSDAKTDWGFGETIDKAVAMVEGEQETQRKAEAAKKARLEKARERAKMVRDRIMLPLLNDLRDDFAADEERVLPEWRVQCREDADVFCGEAITPTLDAGGSTYFTISAESAVVEDGKFVNLSVVCSSVHPNDTLASQLAPLFDKATKLPAEHGFDEWSSRTWVYKQLAECARMCVLARIRQG